MGEFPSGQRGQTVNLLSTTSVVRIHSPPPLTKPCMECAGLLLYVAQLFWSDFLHWVGDGQSWNIASCFARLHIKMDIADKVSAYSFCEFGVAPSAFCPDPHRDPHAEMVRNNRGVLGYPPLYPSASCFQADPLPFNLVTNSPEIISSKDFSRM